MAEERAFLAALAANPGDDVTRLVYADWLDDHRDVRAAFLRNEIELASLDVNDPRAVALSQQLSSQLRTLSPDWVRAAGKRWDVWLDGYEPSRKIMAIKAVRMLSGCSL